MAPLLTFSAARACTRSPTRLLVALLLLTTACAHTLPGPPDATPGDHAGSLTVEGRKRTFTFRIPQSYDARTPLPLVLGFHGRGGDGEGHEWLGHFNEIAEREGVIAVYPDGLDRSWNDARGRTPSSRKGVDDVAFVRALLTLFLESYPIDPRRVYAHGMSNGGFFTHTLACRMSDAITAFAAVTATVPVALQETCDVQRGVPMLMILGSEDLLVPIEGDSFEGLHVSATASREHWAQISGCEAEPTIDTLPDTEDDGTTIERERHGDCRDGAEVVLLKVQGGGHTWPGGEQYMPVRWIGRTSRDLDASEAIWQFFASHPATE